MPNSWKCNAISRHPGNGRRKRLTRVWVTGTDFKGDILICSYEQGHRKRCKLACGGRFGFHGRRKKLVRLAVTRPRRQTKNLARRLHQEKNLVQEVEASEKTSRLEAKFLKERRMRILKLKMEIKEQFAIINDTHNIIGELRKKFLSEMTALHQ